MRGVVRRAGALAVGAALCLTACQDGGRRPPAEPTVSPPTSTGPSSPAPAEPSTGTTAGTGGGRTVVAPGETVRHEVTGGAVLELTVKSVEATPSCPGRGVDAEPLETFVVLDVTASLVPAEAGAEPSADGGESGDPGGTGDGYAAVTPDLFRIAAPDGRVQEIVATDASWACFEDEVLLPPFVDLGQTVAGTIVLDSASPHGSVVYAPEGSAGWEWEF